MFVYRIQYFGKYTELWWDYEIVTDRDNLMNRLRAVRKSLPEEEFRAIPDWNVL